MNIYLKVFIYSSSIYLKKKKVVKYGVSLICKSVFCLDFIQCPTLLKTVAVHKIFVIQKKPKTLFI